MSSAPNVSKEDEELESISLTIIPPAAQQEATGTQPSSEEETQPPAVALFTALSNCSNLHPDPIEEDEADLQDSTLFQAGMIAPGSASGGLPPPMSGSGGWIKAENVSEYFDEDGNWRDGEEGEEGEEGEDEHLGPGAGTVRSWEEDLGLEEVIRSGRGLHDSHGKCAFGKILLRLRDDEELPLCLVG
jgi:chloride channel, nucleotide-sensitive, 1A